MKNKELNQQEITAIWFDGEEVNLPVIAEQVSVVPAQITEMSPSVAKPYIPQSPGVSLTETPQYKVARTAFSWAVTGAICVVCLGGFAWVVASVLEALSPTFAAISTGVDLAIVAGLKGLLVLAFILALFKLLPYLSTKSESKYESPTTVANTNSFNNPNINIQVNVGGQQKNA